MLCYQPILGELILWTLPSGGWSTRMEVIYKYDFKVKSIVQGTGELFNASFYLKAQDHFRATIPGAGLKRDVSSKSWTHRGNYYTLDKVDIHATLLLKGNCLFVIEYWNFSVPCCQWWSELVQVIFKDILHWELFREGAPVYGGPQICQGPRFVRSLDLSGP